MNRDNILIVALFVVLIAVDLTLEVNKSLFYTIFSAGVLIIELLSFVKYQKIISHNKDSIIKLKSNDWIGAIVIAGYLIYSISDEPKNPWLILAILFILTFTGIYLYKNLKVNFILDEQGIRNINRNKVIPAQEITDTELSDKTVSFHTKKYRNDLVIKSSELEYPSWDDLKIRVVKLNSTWAKQKK